MPHHIVTIDGPAGSGKSTVARKLANKLRFIHLNSGALYRAVGLRAHADGVALDDPNGLKKTSEQLSFSFSLREDGSTELLVDGRDLSNEFLSREAGDLASRVGAVPEVRHVLDQVQRSEGQRNSLVLEGRDAGSVVFPDARFKFFLQASASVRAKRRWLELKGLNPNGMVPELAVIQREIEERDRRDSTRAIAPQVVPQGAVVIDTSELTVDEVVERIARAILVS